METSESDFAETKTVADNANCDSTKEKHSHDMEQLVKQTTEISLKEETEGSAVKIPSKITDRKWLWAESSEEYRRQDDPLGGKWLIFLNETDKDKDDLSTVDKAWALIEKSTVENMFYQAKVSTAVKEPYASNDDSGVIVIYTKDFDDLDDINKNAKNIENVLKDYLSPKNYIRYKTNAATEARLYPSQNCTNVTNYRYSLKFGLQVRKDSIWVSAIAKNPTNKKHLNKPKSNKN